MNAPFSQKNRAGSLTTSLKGETLVLLQHEGEEELCGGFEWRVEAVSAKDGLDLNKLLGTHATVELDTQEGPRFFDGIVCEAAFAGFGDMGARYNFVLRDWLHLAGLRRNQRIFHNKTVLEIVEEVLSDYSDLGSPHLNVGASDPYPKLEYTVQYGESDADFVRRQLERHGITWHWTHSKGNHALTLTDWIEDHPVLAGETRPLREIGGHDKAEEECFRNWRGGGRVTTGAVRLTEWNFKMPQAMQEVDRAGEAEHAKGRIESFDWPGDYLEQSMGRAVVNRRVESERGQAARHYATGEVPGMTAGMRVKIRGDEHPGVTGKEFLCLKATHSYGRQSYGSRAMIEGDDVVYEGTYDFMPMDAPLRPERRTRIPVVNGPQTAMVVGEGEIDCDEYGRILVHFPWDLDKRYSMRCRVSQNWAHKGYGGMVIPRIGMEVVVEFLEGDPDKPLVTGCVYNGANMPPYDLPGNKTKSTFKTDTHQGEGYNELMFEDEKDKQLIYMHGQKDQQITILNDRTKSIGRDQIESIARDKGIGVGQDHSETIGRDARHKIERDVIYEVGQNQQEKYGKDHVHVVGNIHKQDIHADHLVKTGRNHDETVLGTYTLNVNKSITNNTKVHTLMAFDKFVIKGPGGKITIDSSGITLEAPQINLKGNVSMGGSGGAQVPTLQGAANDGLPLVEECLKQDDE